MLKRVIASVLFVLAAPVSAELYDDATLRAVTAQMGPNLRYMVTVDIPPTVPPGMRAKAEAIDAVLIPRGRHPLDFFSDPDGAKVYIPIESVRFFDEIAIIQAWFDSRDCDAAWIQSYLWALLRTGRDLPPPIDAFGLDRAALLEDPFTEDVSGKALKSGVLFILAHEVGHILMRHQGGAEGPFSQSQEHAADAFALEHFRAIGQVPAGAAIYFVAARWLDRTGTGALRATHPVAPDRIERIAAELAADPAGFSHTEPFARAVREGRVRSLSSDLNRIAELSSDERMLTLLPAGLVADFPLDRLREACPL